MARRTENYALIVCDWLGRYAYEWQSLWTNDLTQNRNMDYVVSYIYEKEEREQRRDEFAASLPSTAHLGRKLKPLSPKPASGLG